MQHIIDEVSDLMRLPEDKITEKLLDEKYNMANLRELVRRSIDVARGYKLAFEGSASLKETAHDLNIKDNTVYLDGFELHNTLEYHLRQRAIDKHAVLTVSLLVDMPED